MVIIPAPPEPKKTEKSSQGRDEFINCDFHLVCPLIRGAKLLRIAMLNASQVGTHFRICEEITLERHSVLLFFFAFKMAVVQ